MWWGGANYILPGISGGQNVFLHVSKLEICPLYCDLEEGQNCCLVQVKPRRSCSFQRPPASREDCSPGWPDRCFAAVLTANINTREGKTGAGGTQ